MKKKVSQAQLNTQRLSQITRIYLTISYEDIIRQEFYVNYLDLMWNWCNKTSHVICLHVSAAVSHLSTFPVFDYVYLQRYFSAFLNNVCLTTCLRMGCNTQNLWLLFATEADIVVSFTQSVSTETRHGTEAVAERIKPRGLQFTHETQEKRTNREAARSYRGRDHPHHMTRTGFI